MKHVMHQKPFLSLLAVFVIIATTGTVVLSASSINNNKKTTATSTTPSSFLDDTISKLYSRVTNLQWSDEKPYRFPIDFGHRKGTFHSSVHMNVFGNPATDLLRRKMGIPDDNSFVTIFTMDNIFTANMYAGDKLIGLNGTMLENGVNAVLQVKDKNAPADYGLFGFWPQVFKKDSVGSFWEQWSINMSELGVYGTDFSEIIKALLDKIGLGWLYDLVFTWINRFLNIITKAFNLPADADDTGNIISLGSRWLIGEAQKSHAFYPGARKAFADKKYNLSAAFQRVVDVAYCPLATNRPEVNIIDPRTWVWGREFFKTLSSPDDCLVTTWIKNASQEAAFWQNKTRTTMAPFNINNVDPSVSSNLLYGFATAAVFDSTGDIARWFQDNTRAKKVFLTTAKLIAWTLENQINIVRTDLESLYYPTILQFPAFAARLLNFLDTHKDKLPFPELHEIRVMLTSAMENGGTNYVLSRIKSNCSIHHDELRKAGNDVEEKNKETKIRRGRRGDHHDSDSDYYACADSFLGNADANWNGVKTPHYDDRYFSTSTSVLALLNTWTTTRSPAAAADHHHVRNNNDNNSSMPLPLYWKKNTPTFAKFAAENAINWLNDFYINNAANSDAFMCAFFSGSVHNYTASVWNYPANVVELLTNGTEYSCADSWISTTFPFDKFDALMIGVRGIMPESEFVKIYESGSCIGMFMGSLTKTSYNDPASPWPFWSSESLTLSTAMNAMSMFRAIVN